MFAAALLFASRGAVAGVALTDNEDGAHRTPDIHWPRGFTPEDADLFAHNDITIDAPCSVVWQHLIAAPAWPSWYANAHDVIVHGQPADRLSKGARFEFVTFGLHFDAKVAEFVPNRRLAWFGNGKGNDAYHPWLLQSVGHACHVTTEEVAKGPGAVALRERDKDAMHKGHDLWLKGLKDVSERQ
ncbi:MAG: SRPBCC domain-containing protein [Pararobbsia sp.]